MRIILALLGLLMMAGGFAVFGGSKSAFQEQVAVLLFGFGVLAIGLTGVINALVQIRDRLSAPDGKDGPRIAG